MKERLKTFLLISLVSISIILTKNLWLQAPEQLFTFADKERELNSYVLADMIAPSKYLLNFSEINHTILYDDMKYGIWDKSKSSLIEALTAKEFELKEISNEEFINYHNVKSAVFYFADDTNSYILTRALDIKDPNDIVDRMPYMDSIYIYLGDGNSFFIFSNDDKHLAAHYPKMDISSLKEELDIIDESQEYTYYHSMKWYGAKPNIYIPLEIEYSLPEIYVANDLYSMNESEKKQLVEKFLGKDIGYIRQIVEGNGSTIYVYNQKYLKLNSNGLIEYFHALENRVTERNLFLSLSTAADFLSSNAEILKGMYLADVQEIEQDGSVGYKLSYRFRVRGIPILLGNREVEEYVTIEVFNDHIRSYKYYPRKDMNKLPNRNIDKSKILPAFDVIDKNAGFFKELYIDTFNIDNMPENIVDGVLASIEDITLAYYDPCLMEYNEKLIPVWAIRFKGKTYAFDAYNGILVYER
ncbi:MAG: hypothetical protein GX185_02280 [Tissierellia bacterium]|nr:hypothetical protein [Tissierellia bacterium]